MMRISSDMTNSDLQFRLRRHESSVAAMQSKMGTQNRLQELRDDPLAAAKAVRYESVLARMDRFEQNALYAQDFFKVSDAHMRQTQEIMQRIRELAVTGANGIYSQEDLSAMGVEVNELLKELVQVSNASGPDGTRLFAGDKSLTEPFRVIEGSVGNAIETGIQEVIWQGADASRQAEISEGAFIDLDIPGSKAFWAEKMQIFSSFDASAYRVPQAAQIMVDGHAVQLEAGDTIHAIVHKINQSPAPVKAYVDPISKGLALEGTSAHRIRLDDSQGSTVLKDLGILADTSDPQASSFHPSARVSGGSMFDVVIQLRDALFRGDGETVGSLALGGVDRAMTNINTRLAEIGSRHERSEVTWNRLNEQIPDITAHLAREKSLDFTSAALELNMLEFAHKATLQTASKLTKTTLLDFLR